MSANRTEKPTFKKKKDARKKGKVAYSADFTGACLFIIVTLALIGWCPWAIRKYYVFARQLWGASGLWRADLMQADPGALIGECLHALAMVFLPVVVGGLLWGFIQIGPLCVPVRCDLKRISPVGGVKQLFGKRKILDFILMVTKFAAMSALVIVWICGERRHVGQLCVTARLPLEGMTRLLFRAVILFMGVFSAFGILDLVIQRRRWINDLMMSRRDVEKEQKDVEGDAGIKARRQQLHRESLESSLPGRVAASAVVVVNPTHYAVALHYEWGNDTAPTVAARGAFAGARRIREAAWTYGIPVLRHPPLARQLFLLKEDQDIPEELFQPVAELLIYLMEMPKEARLRCR